MKILDLDISAFDYKELLNCIETSISAGSDLSITYVNAYVSLNAHKEQYLLDILNKFSLLHADGIGVYFASKYLWKEKGLSKRITGTDLYFKVLATAQEKGYGVFFWGGSSEAICALSQSLVNDFPLLKINGIVSREIEYSEELMKQLNQSDSDILFLGLGTPSQEKWIAKFGKKCNIPIKICVGSGIDFLAGTYSRAPGFLRKLGLEWFYRMLIEPSRLWRRYLLGIPEFIFLIIKQKIFNNKQN